MNKATFKLVATASLLMSALLLQGCSPEVGSKEWCADLKEKPKGEWSVNEGKDFAKHCIF